MTSDQPFADLVPWSGPNPTIENEARHPDKGDYLRAAVQGEAPSAQVIPLFALGGLPKA